MTYQFFDICLNSFFNVLFVSSALFTFLFMTIDRCVYKCNAILDLFDSNIIPITFYESCLFILQFSQRFVMNALCKWYKFLLSLLLLLWFYKGICKKRHGYEIIQRRLSVELCVCSSFSSQIHVYLKWSWLHSQLNWLFFFFIWNVMYAICVCMFLLWSFFFSFLLFLCMIGDCMVIAWIWTRECRD